MIIRDEIHRESPCCGRSPDRATLADPAVARSPDRATWVDRRSHVNSGDLRSGFRRGRETCAEPGPGCGISC